MLLLLLSRISRVQLCATPQTAAHQAPPSLGFSRQENWSRLPFPSPMHESEVAQSCPTLSDPMGCSPPGSSIHGVFQARVLELFAIALSVPYVQSSLIPTVEKMKTFSVIHISISTALFIDFFFISNLRLIILVFQGTISYLEP